MTSKVPKSYVVSRMWLHHKTYVYYILEPENEEFIGTGHPLGTDFSLGPPHRPQLMKDDIPAGQKYQEQTIHDKPSAITRLAASRFMTTSSTSVITDFPLHRGGGMIRGMAMTASGMRIPFYNSRSWSSRSC